MRLYLDDDSAEALLVALLRQAGHDVQIPRDVGMIGQPDAVHLTQAAAGVAVGDHFHILNHWR